VATIVGFAFTLFGIAVLVLVIARYFLQGAVVPGFAFLASIIAIFAGAQLFALGIIGEYLGRMHMRTMERPPYLVRTTTHAGERT
jgi:undecaprenyl-phosphate 4-deoxy-4-formamido-L-arabinose transferase